MILATLSLLPTFATQSPLPSTPAAPIASAAPAAGAQSTVPLLDHRQLQVAMSRLATEHPDLVTVIPVGELASRGKRRIDALRLSAGERKPGRPAILVVANLDGPWVWTSGLALRHAQKLSEGYATDPRIKALLDSTTIYVLPRANPDAAEARFLKPLFEARASGFGVDNDRDGRSGEDGPSDVDGDGLVLSMRVPDPDGEWMADPADPRASIKADRKKGQHGIWKLFPEGRDSDKDEKAGEDPELDALVNRNFPQGWKAHDPESGQFATDEPEARDLCRFVIEHKEIALVVTYGALDNLVEKPKTAKEDGPRARGVPPEGTLESDADLLAEIGRRYKRITKSKVKGDGDDHGSFQSWCQTQRGLWCLAIAPWTLPIEDGEKKGDKGKGDKTDSKSEEPETKGDKPKDKDEDKPAPSDDAKRLKWIDARAESARFVPWKKFQHPDFGEVEIGGLAPYATVEPPASEQDGIADRELEFLLGLGEILPRVRVQECTAKDLHGGVWEVKAAIEDDALLPLMSSAAKRCESVRPARVTLVLPAGARILAGESQQLVRDLPGSGGRKEMRWLVNGAQPSSIAIEVDTDHAGTAKVAPEVK
jgi:hypothetical protein